MTSSTTYAGPQCPHCSVALDADSIVSGAIICPRCDSLFEATAFTPPERNQAATLEVVQVGPEGASACANHARNAATASCQRCGLFICSLCDMNIGTGSYCPSCFERVLAEGSLQPAARRYRDYAMMARSASIAGLLFSLMLIGIPFGALSIYYGAKARKQRIAEERSSAGLVFVMIFGVVEILIGIASIGFVFYAIGKSS
jgi:ribosomal protein L37AE/L43A